MVAGQTVPTGPGELRIANCGRWPKAADLHPPHVLLKHFRFAIASRLVTASPATIERTAFSTFLPEMVYGTALTASTRPGT